MVPLDVANARSNGGLDMKTFWFIIYCIIAFMVTVFLPFSIFLYETDEEKSIVVIF